MSLAKRTHFFVVAHPDDIELFMFKALVDAITNNDRVVLIVATAGDNGRGYPKSPANCVKHLLMKII